MLRNKDGEMVINVPWLLDSVSSSEKTMPTGSFKELTVSCIQRKRKSVINCHSDQEKIPKRWAAIYQRKRIQLICLAATALPRHLTNKQNHQDSEKNPQRISNPPRKKPPKKPLT
jgi:hypothetical protein